MAQIEIIEGKESYYKGIMGGADILTVLFTYDSVDDEYDAYPVGNFQNKVLVYSIDEEEISPLQYKVEFAIEKYTTNFITSGNIRFIIANEQSTITESVDIPYSISDIFKPIWEDYELSIPEGVYNILVNEEIVYTGYAKAIPSETNALINLSPIVRSLMDKIKLSNLTTTQWNNNLEVMFVRVTDGNGVNKGSLTYTYDYSYKPLDTHSNSYIIKNEPINRHIANNQIAPLSILNLGSNEFLLNGTSIGDPLSNKVYTYIYPSDTINVNYSISPSTGILSYSNGYCGDGYLLYANRMGGYDTFLIEGGIKKTDTYTQSDYMTRSNNTNNHSFANNRFVSSISTSYELTTGWLSDDESRRLAFNLLPSNEVYFYRFADAAFVPVVITNSSTQYQTFKSNDRKFCQYIINITESRDKLLR